MKLGVRGRLALSFSWVFAILLVIFSGVIYYFMSANLESELHAQVAHDAKQVVREFDELSWDKALIEMNEEAEEFQFAIQIVDEHGKVAYRVADVGEWNWPVDPVFLNRALEGPVWKNLYLHNQPHLLYAQPIPNAPGGRHVLMTARSRADVNHIRSQLIRCINIGTPILLVLSIFVGHWFSRKALSGVEKIRERAETVSTANMNQRLSYDGPPDELSRLTETLNQMIARIQRSFEQMKQFVADASHELRIPLAGLRGTLEVALRQDRTKEEYRESLQNAYTESERLSELVWDLLSLAKADAAEMKLDKKEHDVAEFLENVFAAGEMLNVDENVVFKLGAVAKGKAIFDEIKIHQVILNLLENAIRYNRPNGEILLSSELTPKEWVVSVKDQGIGIAVEDQAKIFDRFYRVDKARAREQGGTGLGLAIARSITEAHKGTLTVSSVLGEGSTFTLRLPL